MWALMIVSFGMIGCAARRYRGATSMSAKRGFALGRAAASTFGRNYYWNRLPLLLAAVAIGMAGCNGGSGGGPASGGSAGGNAPLTKPAGRGTVVVTVTDLLGDPLVGAGVEIWTAWSDEDRWVVADLNGRAEVKDVIADSFFVTVFGPDSHGFAGPRNLAAGATLAVDITAVPTGEATAGVVRAWVAPDGISDEGRTLEFSLEIVGATPGSAELWSFGTASIAACTPNPDNDVPRFRPDCISGADGLDAAYSSLPALTKKVHPAGSTTDATRTATALLVDQSTQIIATDPADSRLFAAKYFLSLSNDSARTVLAAFSSDDAVSGQLSLLPEKPVTVFPLENPQFTADGRSYFATVDQMGALEGGTSPLFAAIDRMLDFAAADPIQHAKAVVVVTNGHDDTCGTKIECRSVLDGLMQKSKTTGVAIVAVGLQDTAGTADREALGLLSQGTERGATFWISNPKQLTPILGNVRSFLGGNNDTLEVPFRIESPVIGAFASGRTVIGQVHLEVCTYGCSYAVIPFVIEVP